MKKLKILQLWIRRKRGFKNGDLLFVIPWYVYLKMFEREWRRSMQNIFLVFLLMYKFL